MDPAVIGHKPPTIKWLQGLAWFKLGFFALLVFLALSFLLPTQSANRFWEHFREGSLQRFGYSPDQYGLYEAGMVVATGYIPAVLAGFVLECINRRVLIPLRIGALLGVLFSLRASLGHLFISVLMLVLTFVSSTKVYCDHSAATQGPRTAN